MLASARRFPRRLIASGKMMRARGTVPVASLEAAFELGAQRCVWSRPFGVGAAIRREPSRPSAPTTAAS